MDEYFGFKWPWTRVCKLAVEETDKLRWIGDQWVWSTNDGEGLAMYMPLSPPRGSDGKQQSRALADWYRQRSSLFSDNWGIKYGPHGPDQPEAKTRDEPVVTPSVGQIGPDSPPPDGGYIPSSQDFAAFKVVLITAIAKAWQHERFRETLELDAKTALREIRGYELPWKLGIHIHDDPDARWHAPDEHAAHPNHHQSYWDNERPHTLKLFLPARPRDLTSEPIALASYNAAGAEYPFTCCCAP